jgi:putative NADH-flavin reductase
VERALARGHQVTALARDPAKVANSHDRLRVVKGDVLDASSLDDAVEGQDAVLSALGNRGDRSSPGFLGDGIANVITAMDRSGVRRLVAVSAFGAGESRGQGGFLFNNVIRRIPPVGKQFDEKEPMEAAIRASDLDWTIVQPTRLTTAAPTGAWKVIFEGGGLTAKVSRADVAEFVVAQLDDDSYVRKAPGITG